MISPTFVILFLTTFVILIILTPGAVSRAQLAVEVVVHKLLVVPPPRDQNHYDHYNNYDNCYSFISPS